MDKKSIKELIRERRVYLDGGCGTMLQKRGLKSGEPPELWNITHPEEIVRLHKEYLSAGSDIIASNTFGVNPLKHENYTELLDAALSCAKAALSEYSGRYLALDIGPTGRLLAPYGDLEFEEAVAAFSKVIEYSKDRVDLILIETMNDSYETKAALLAAKESCSLPVFVTNVYSEKQTLMTGADAVTMAAVLEGMGADAIGLNCSLGPELMLPIVNTLANVTDLPIIVKPNAGLPQIINGVTVFDNDAEKFSDAVVKLAEAGASIIGGCCGSEPEYIRKSIEKTSFIPLPEFEEKNITLFSSYTHSVVVGDKPVLIGERINPTGKSKLKAALREKNINYVLGEAIRQVEAGVHALDVNAGLPDIDEKEILKRCVCELQGVTDVPLQIDTADPIALEAAMRIYNGKPLVNSVNGKKESMESVFPLVKKYGGVLIALTLDENGIPDSAKGRVAIAERIISRAGEYGIKKKDIIVDPLALTISSDPASAKITLDAIRMLKDKGINTSLGVSNISFGLPSREIINSAFFSQALLCGLSCAIMNPFSEGMMNSYYAYNALSGKDSACSEYISYASGKTDTLQKPSQQNMTLYDCIVNGLSGNAESIARELVLTKDGLDIINTEIIPALNKIGDMFEKGKAFLPQLLMSADASSSAFSVIKEAMPKGSSSAERGIVLATVKGDIHDIGKNIVRTLLESYGFTVYDLGRDVPPQDVLEAVKKYSCRLVALSALMTTTVPAMEDTVRLLHSYDKNIKVMVGGAVLTREYAEMIGADGYSPDAMGVVRFAEEYYGK
ncbi:MAG: homocysteine S-methyltransferase family protein [Clostridia bacterium]|nr:homocysteine S-methyltransferase family protein [Clostridia bacterium]